MSALIDACMWASDIRRRYQLQEWNFSLEIHSKLIHLNTDTFHLDN